MQALDPLSIKYFKLAVDNKSIRKDTATEISANCPLCGDKKHRLHLYRPQGFKQDVVHCFNSGCELEEKHHSVINFLKMVKPEYVSGYQRENLTNIVNDISPNLDSIIKTIEDNTGIKKTNENKKHLEIPLDKLFMKCKDSDKCTEYIKKRGFDPKDDWYFSEDKFFTHNSKKVYLKDYLLIPIYQDKKYKGFYSRSIIEKSFSTFLLPDVEKIWVSSPDTNVENLEIICEGVFDALSTGFKHTGAMLSASLSEGYLNDLKTLNPDCILAFDNDITGIQKAIKYAEQGFKVFIPPEDWKFKDFNEALQSNIPIFGIKEVILRNIKQGIEAVIRLKMIEG